MRLYFLNGPLNDKVGEGMYRLGVTSFVAWGEFQGEVVYTISQ